MADNVVVKVLVDYKKYQRLKNTVDEIQQKGQSCGDSVTQTCDSEAGAACKPVQRQMSRDIEHKKPEMAHDNGNLLSTNSVLKNFAENERTKVAHMLKALGVETDGVDTFKLNKTLYSPEQLLSLIKLALSKKRVSKLKGEKDFFQALFNRGLAKHVTNKFKLKQFNPSFSPTKRKDLSTFWLLK